MKHKNPSSSPTFPTKQRWTSAFVVLGYSILKVFPDVQLLSGGLNDQGFFYDFVKDKHLVNQALSQIEEQMRGIIKSNLPFKAVEMMRENAANFFDHHHQPLKAALVEEGEGNIVSICQIEKFYEICSPPYLPSTGEIGVFKLQDIQEIEVIYPIIGPVSVKRLQGIACADKESLKKNLKIQELIKKNDHKLLVNQLKLGVFIEEIGAESFIWQPKGLQLREFLVNLLKRELKAQQFQEIATPRLVKEELLRKVGSNSTLSLFIDGIPYGLTPSNSSLHAQYVKKIASNELPIKLHEFANVYDDGHHYQLSGLLRTRSVYLDSQSIFCSTHQVLEELISSLQFLNKTIIMLGFKHRCYLNLRGHTYRGSRDKWEQFEVLLREAFNACGLSDLAVDAQESATERFCSGPRIEMRLVDMYDREWKGPFVGVDTILPERLKLCYQDLDGKKESPTMIVRSLYGALELFIAILLEHYRGYLPLWLAPEQVRVIPIGSANIAYARAIGAKLEQEGFRISVDCSQNKLGGKIHALEQEKIPYGIVVGEKEEKEGVLTVRSCSQQEMRNHVSLASFLKGLQEELASTTSHFLHEEKLS